MTLASEDRNQVQWTGSVLSTEAGAMQVSLPRFPTTGCPETEYSYTTDISTPGVGEWAINTWESLQKKICHPGLGTLLRSGPNSSLPIKCSVSGSCFFLPNILCSHSLFSQCSAILPLPTLSCKMNSLSFPTSSQDDPIFPSLLCFWAPSGTSCSLHFPQMCIPEDSDCHLPRTSRPQCLF